MKAFLDISVRGKLLTVFAVIIALFAVVIAVAYSSIESLLDAQNDARTKQVNVSELSQIIAHHNEGRVSVLMFLSTTDRVEQQKHIEAVRSEHADNEKLLESLRDRNPTAPKLLGKLDEHIKIRKTYAEVRERVFELGLEGNVAEARRISLTENNKRYTEMRDIIYLLIRDAEQEAEAARVYARQTAEQAQKVFLIAGCVALGFSMLGVFALGRMIADPLQLLVGTAQRVSRGDLAASVPAIDRDDEVGVLNKAFGTMVDNLRTMHREVQEGVNVLATSASEIFTATAQIAASATETATAVSQTTSTAEEVKQTAQLSAQKAGHVADVAQKAAQSAQTGRKAIEESISGMSNVREQMELIAETVVRLSEQSQAIGEIISSVNDLAEQSNLLAVNASIEAAKAGEHGKGFAVVAQEIRNLATQSKESTAQVRNILNDIQRATSATVMAAEQGSKAVDAGVKQVNQSGDAIRTLAESIVLAAQAATQITASSQEQLIGIDQVTMAIQNILQASRQNATGTQQAEAGAKNLNQLGQNLKQVVGRFTV